MLDTASSTLATLTPENVDWAIVVYIVYWKKTWDPSKASMSLINMRELHMNAPMVRVRMFSWFYALLADCSVKRLLCLFLSANLERFYYVIFKYFITLHCGQLKITLTTLHFLMIHPRLTDLLKSYIVYHSPNTYRMMLYDSLKASIRKKNIENNRNSCVTRKKVLIYTDRPHMVPDETKFFVVLADRQTMSWRDDQQSSLYKQTKQLTTK